MIRWLLEHAPSILPLFHACYGEVATLHFEGHTLSSSHGCQQGCPLGTLLFCARESAMLQELREWHTLVTFLSFADDLFLLGPPHATAAAFEDWRALTAAAGEAPNLSKCSAYSPHFPSLITVHALHECAFKRVAPTNLDVGDYVEWAFASLRATSPPPSPGC
eukprot:SAG31_NODE_162_length_21892_cov_343.171936_8_plen_163_part_00